MERDALAVVPEAAPAAPKPGRANAFRALRSVPFRWYFGGQIASASGTFVQTTAIGWLVLGITGSPASLGLVLAASGVPPLLFGPWGGVVADRVDLRKLLIGTQAAAAVLAVVLWLAAASGHAGVPLVMMALVGLLAFNFAVILPVLAKDTFHGTGGTYGLLSTMLSLGSVAGSLAVGLVRHPRRVYLVAAAAAFGACLVATTLAPTLAVACGALVATGIAAFCFVTLASTALQLHADPAYRGRIMALWVFVYLGTTPIGSPLTGWICDAAGPRAALLVGAAACLVAAGIAARVRTPPHPDD